MLEKDKFMVFIGKAQAKRPSIATFSTLPEIMIPDLNMLGATMKHWILIELNATLNVTVYHSRLHSLPEKSHKQLPHLDSFTPTRFALLASTFLQFVTEA